MIPRIRLSLPSHLPVSLIPLVLFIAYELTTAHSPCQIPIQLRRPFISCHTNNNRSTSGNVLEALIQSKLRDVVISRHPSTTNQRREPFGVTQLGWKCTHKLCMIGHGSDFSSHRARLISLCPEWRMIIWVEASVDITFDWLLVDWLVKQKLKGKILLLGVVEARQTYHLEHISSAMRQLQSFNKGIFLAAINIAPPTASKLFLNLTWADHVEL